ncbi:ACP S-malonyltransferase [Microbacterium radiodurans]|uniref:[acyl-carrier-protein] S-malonyltransferase n=1 Tax=Microbacterium radiodurans TaxID=661398 RepID=A0A5J5IUX1_9MICO|nr:ACP S-malonyltransferase [Microbacterium radiodurans]KAA9087074.1 ACP S-malonyltransferase [Microbacterium radiodurans]
MIIAVFPGQGSQTPGFLEPWLELDGVRERLERYSDLAELDLVAAGTTWDADRIRDTRVAQPLIVAASLVSFAALTRRGDGAPDLTPDGVAGHSVGEVAALVAAGVLGDEDGMRLVGIRGRAMADAAALTETGMSAVLGGDQEAVVARLDELGLTPANYNGGGQIVAAGARASLDALASDPVPRTRVIPLPVAGAFHTDYMAPAVAALEAAAADAAIADPTLPLWSNRDGAIVADGRDAVARLVAQIASPVRWDLCMEAFASRAVTGIVEFAPAGTLVGLAKRSLRGIPSVAVSSPADLDAAAALISGDNA